MAIIQERMNARDREIKEIIINKLITDGYGTYAKRLKEFDFIVADIFEGTPIPTAAMFTSLGTIVINPGFLVATDPRSQELQLDRLSVLIRHELLHALLMHQRRFIDHMEKQNLDDFKDYTVDMVQEMQNMAADWELSERGYDEHDKDIVRNMELNGRVIGGLILEDDHPEWLGKTFEEIFDLQKPEYDQAIKDAKEALKNQPKTTINVHKATHSPDYVKMYNKIVAKYNKDTISEQELNDLLDQISKMSEEDLDTLA